MSDLFTSGSVRIGEMASCEKLWLLAEEMYRDNGIEDVNAEHLAVLFGQALALAVIHNSTAPLNRGTLSHVMKRAEGAAQETHDLVLAHLQRSRAN